VEKILLEWIVLGVTVVKGKAYALIGLNMGILVVCFISNMALAFREWPYN
jgi:hypothetical protein